jgi:hypothetical protein
MMCDRYRKCQLTRGKATVIGKGEIGDNWFPCVYLYDKDGNQLGFLQSEQTRSLYQGLKITFVRMGLGSNSDLFEFEWKDIKYKVLVRAGFVYITKHDLVGYESEICIDGSAAKDLLRAIEEIA